MNHALPLITIGSLLFLGLVTEAIGKRTKLPRVTLLLIFGFAIGPAGFNLLPKDIINWFPLTTSIALAMIGFLLGCQLSIKNLRSRGRAILSISISVALITALIVFVGLYLSGVNINIALLLAAISTATAPAATTAVVQESKQDNVFTRTLLGVVAIDDVWGLIIFSICLAAAHIGNGSEQVAVIMQSLREIIGATILGVGLGIPMAYMTGRLESGEPTLVEAISLVLLCSGLAAWLHVSFILSSLILGATVANLAKHHKRPFHEIEHIEWPFMILFFLLAGASLQLDALRAAGAAGSFYIVYRIFARLLGGYIGALIAKSKKNLRNWIGLALLPQAGVALGMALVASQSLPQYANVIMPIALAATVVFELIGPIATRIAINKS